ncbi:hypothetical protein JW960_01295 [candidate division KSB1 bacterium]|nr:hypothetical protein [candidate division KSB1 bacterium]
MKLRVCLICLAFLSSFQSLASANPETSHKTFRVPLVDDHITVDARLDETIWSQAVRIDANIEVRPGENIPAPVKTEVLIAHNHTHLFVGFIAHDPEPSKIRARLCDRDQIFDDDWVLILFDTFNDQRRTYDFACNPLGIQAEMIETTTGDGGEWDVPFGNPTVASPTKVIL